MKGSIHQNMFGWQNKKIFQKDKHLPYEYKVVFPFHTFFPNCRKQNKTNVNLSDGRKRSQNLSSFAILIEAK